MFYGEIGNIAVIYWRKVCQFGGWFGWIRGNRGDGTAAAIIAISQCIFYHQDTKKEEKKYSSLDPSFDSENAADSEESEWLLAVSIWRLAPNPKSIVSELSSQSSVSSEAQASA